ncbi:MAG: BBP7 family outer membrane beta-barrel protein [Planctomycetota bacterium]
MSTNWIHTCRVAALVMLVAVPASGQSPRSRAADDLEQDARRSWQPVRDLSRRPTKAKTKSKPTSVRLAQHAAPLPEPVASSVIAPPMQAPSVPLDGQVVLEPFHGTTYDAGCDSLPGAACGCGDVGCDGYCAAPACGTCTGIGCSTGTCCNGDPMCGQYRDCDALQPCITICWPQDGWLSAEYLMWWQDGMNTPPLASDGPIASAQNPGNTGTILFGGDDLLTDHFDGFRLNFGFWLDNCHTWGIGAEYFRIGTETDGFFGDGTTNAALDRPFQNLQLDGAEDSEQVNEDGRVTGSLNIDVDSELLGWGIHLRHLRCAETGCVTDLRCTPQQFCSRTEYLIGFRQVQLTEGIRAQEILTSTQTGITDGFNIVDQFRTRNQFNGLDLGILYTRVRGCWNFDAGLRFAVGNTRQRVRINGSTVLTGTNTDADGVTQTGGFLALPSNIGNYARDEFSILPQLDLKAGYQLTDQLRATFGYTLLYWSNVVRPGDQIDRLVDIDQLPSGPIATTPVIRTFPEFAFNTTDYWAQGLSFGAEYRW